MTDPRVVVVGGGLGGLAAAARLAATGSSVTLLEQAERVGGKLGTVELGGFRFDTGPSLVTMPAVFERLLADQKQLPETAINELRNIAGRTNWLARQTGNADIAILADLSRKCAIDAVVGGLRLSRPTKDKSAGK